MINILLAVFNVLPGAPLDGAGLVELVLVRDATALWLALIGWFVLGAAGQEVRPLALLGLSRVRELPSAQWAATTVGELATPVGEVPVAGPDDPITSLLPRLQAAPEQRGLVLDRGVLVGIVTLSDLARTLAQLTVRSPSAAGSAPAR